MPQPALVDSHCHLDFPDFAMDLNAVLARAEAAGVSKMVTICTRLGSVAATRAIAEAHEGVFFAAGTHPMHAADEAVARVDQLVALAAHPKMIGIGETGLDFHYSSDTARVQEESFRIHIEAARQTGLPLVVHSRGADIEMARVLSDEHAAGRFSCVMHCFTSGVGLAETALDLGFYLSASGIATFRRSDALRAVFASAPIDRLLVETDAPYLAPQPYRGRRNEPAFVTETARIMAEHLGMELPDLAAATTQNFETLFSKASLWGTA